MLLLSKFKERSKNIMEIKTAVEIMLTNAGKKKSYIADFLQISKPSFTNWLSKLDQVKRLIKICDLCGCDIIITDHKNINIKLTNDNIK